MDGEIEALIQNARSGDRSAFERLMKRFQDRAFAVALAQLGNYHQAEDAVQEAFVEAYLRLEQLQSPAAFPAWLRKIVLGKCVRTMRGGKSVTAPLPFHLLIEAVSPVPAPEAVMLERSVRDTLQNAIDLLSEEEREAFLLFAVGSYRYGEIGELMEIPLALVKKRIYTARQRLREGDELAALRPSRHPAFGERVAERMREREKSRVLLREGKGMQKTKSAESQVGPLTVDLVGPGLESKIAVKNLYVFYRYEMLMTNHYDEGITPPADATEETWRSGAWVNQFGVINGLHSETQEASVQGEDVFWEWPNLQAYLIRVNGWPAGFACVASPPNATRGVDYRLQEFFLLNKARRRGVGSAAAHLLFDRLPGRWELAYLEDNLPAAAFWRKFIPEYTGGDFAEEMIGMGSSPDQPGYTFTRGPRPQHPIKVR